MEKVQNSIIVTFPLQFESSGLHLFFIFFHLPACLQILLNSSATNLCHSPSLCPPNTLLHSLKMESCSCNDGWWNYNKNIDLWLAETLNRDGWLEVFFRFQGLHFFLERIGAVKRPPEIKSQKRDYEKWKLGWMCIAQPNVLNLDRQAKKFVFGYMSGLYERADREEWLDVRAER